MAPKNKATKGAESVGKSVRRGRTFEQQDVRSLPTSPFFLQPCVYARYLEGEKGILDLSGRLFDILCLGSWNFYTNIT